MKKGALPATIVLVMHFLSMYAARAGNAFAKFIKVESQHNEVERKVVAWAIASKRPLFG
jgi:hypothetical protein